MKFMEKGNKLFLTLLFLFCLMNVYSQVVISSGSLINRKWILKYPSCSNERSELSFDSKYITQRISWPSIGKNLEYSGQYYMSDTLPEAFDSTKVGKNTKGCYLIWQARCKFVCMKILDAKDNGLRMVRVFLPDEFVIGEPDPVLYVSE